MQAEEKKTCSVIIPAYNEEEMIEKTADTIAHIMTRAQIPYEIIFVNDGSRDMTWPRIVAVCQKDPHVQGICFSRNFGKEAAMFAGIEAAEGDCAVIIDCDLQHPPEKIVEMYNLWLQGYEVVEGVKEDRGKESIFHRAAASLFYTILSKISHLNMKDASDFKLMDRKVLEVLKQMPEQSVFFRALSSWVGFESTQVSYVVQKRQAGESKWNYRSLFRYALSNITAFSAAPMQLITLLGAVFLILSLVLGVITLTQKFMGVAQEGFTTVIIVELLVGSMMMISNGIIGYYIAKMYDEVKGRPRYIIGKKYKKNIDNKDKQ